mmetsp:Transcript_28351/g.63320  ORF Transcript_28351/g.63320 Transcript_28351/m.63320 type:complete len:499 (-) Transcript_28351:206-1702(-)
MSRALLRIFGIANVITRSTIATNINLCGAANLASGQEWKPDPSFDQMRWTSALNRCVPIKKEMARADIRLYSSPAFADKGFRSGRETLLCWDAKESLVVGHQGCSVLDPLSAKSNNEGIHRRLGAATIHLIGDSLMRQLYGVAACMCEAGGLKTTVRYTEEMFFQDRATGAHYPPSRFTDLIVRETQGADFVVINTGSHYNYGGGGHGYNKTTYVAAIERFAAWAQGHAQGGRPPRLLWMENWAQHFYGGTYRSGSIAARLQEPGGVRQCAELKPRDRAVAQWRNAIANPELERAGVTVLPQFASTFPMHRDHNGVDCTHFCLNGPVMRQTARNLLTAVAHELPVLETNFDPRPSIRLDGNKSSSRTTRVANNRILRCPKGYRDEWGKPRNATRQVICRATDGSRAWQCPIGMQRLDQPPFCAPPAAPATPPGGALLGAHNSFPATPEPVAVAPPPPLNKKAALTGNTTWAHKNKWITRAQQRRWKSKLKQIQPESPG